MKVHINELVSALEKLNPQKLNRLKSQNPNYPKLFESGIILGNDDTTFEILILAELCIESNTEVLKKCDIEFPKMKNRIISYRRLNLFSQIITAICSAGVVGTILAKMPNKEFMGILLGFAGLICSLIPIVSEYIVTGINNKKITDSFEDLVKNRLEIEKNNRELKYYLSSKKPDIEKISSLINNSNEKAFFINQSFILL